MVADGNLPLCDARIIDAHARGFIRSKYGSRSSALADILDVQPLVWLLDGLEEGGNRPMSERVTFFLDKATTQGEPLV